MKSKSTLLVAVCAAILLADAPRMSLANSSALTNPCGSDSTFVSAAIDLFRW
jgi:hypothetical protein